jgi:Cft2 family RNA processing exonuclease
MRAARVTPVSGCGGKGPACFLVEADGARVLLDLGYGPQPGVWPDVSGVGPVDALLLSHGHRDHAGGLSLLAQVGEPVVYATDIVRAALPESTVTRSLPLEGTSEVCGICVTAGRNGHAPGGVWLHLGIGGGLLYMGDCSVESSLYAFDPPPPAKTVILDASYGAYDTALVDALPAFSDVFDAGPVLMPVPPAGRGPEIALHLLRCGRGHARVDEAMRSALSALAQPSASIRDDALDDVRSLSRRAPPIEGADGAEGVMLAAVADATGGEAARLTALWEKSGPQIVFTGYLPPGTPAERLTKSGRARYLRWNVHPRLSDNARLVRDTSAQIVLPAFGDAAHLAAWQDAFAPARVELKGPVTL